jgi:hypothetical protein
MHVAPFGRHEALRRPQRKSVVVGGGVADRTGIVAAVGHRQHARRERDCGPSAAAAGGAAHIIGVERRAEDRIEGLRSQSEFRGIGLADQDRARLLHLFHELGVAVRHPVAEQRRAERRAKALGRRQILDGQRKAVQPALTDAAPSNSSFSRASARISSRSRSETIAL